MSRRSGEGAPLCSKTVVCPLLFCQDCGEYYLGEPVAQRVYAQADAAAQRHAEVEVVQYAA